jgi:hypothetical protein
MFWTECKQALPEFSLLNFLLNQILNLSKYMSISFIYRPVVFIDEIVILIDFWNLKSSNTDVRHSESLRLCTLSIVWNSKY